MFVDQLFPTQNLRLVHGLQKSVTAPTTIVGNANVEYRIKKLANYRSSWKYPSRLLSATDRKAIAKFYTEVAEFGLKSFKFKDPDSYLYTNQVLEHAMDGKFYLVVPDTTHPIFHISDSCEVRKNGAVATYTVEVIGNRPVVHVDGASGSDVITISGEYYFAARFDQAIMSWSMEALTTNNTSYGDNLTDLSLIEVFEY